METTRVGRRRATELTWRSAILFGMVVVMLVALVSAGIAAVWARGSAGPSFIHAQPGAVRWDSRDRLNVLILDVDAPTGRGPALGLTVASFDGATRSAHILSIPSSLWVTIPGFGQARIGDAYADGGPRLALLVAQSVTHITIPYYMVLGDDAFHRLLDAYNVTVHDPAFDSLHNPSGAKHLEAAAARVYLRPSGPSSDIVRVLREYRLLGALAHRMLQPQALFQIPAFINNNGRTIDTNLPYDQMPDLARRLTGLPPSRVYHATLDYRSGAVTDYITSGMSVLLPDWQRIHAMTRRGYGDDLRSAGSIEVLNGSGVLGEAASLAQWLRQFGLHVARYGSADRFDYDRTQVVMNTAAHTRAPQVARAASAILQAPVVTRPVRTSKAPVVIVIGRDFQDASQQ